MATAPAPTLLLPVALPVPLPCPRTGDTALSTDPSGNEPSNVRTRSHCTLLPAACSGPALSPPAMTKAPRMVGSVASGVTAKSCRPTNTVT